MHANSIKFFIVHNLFLIIDFLFLIFSLKKFDSNSMMQLIETCFTFPTILVGQLNAVFRAFR